MRNLKRIFGRLIAAILICVPLQGFALTGVIITPYTFTGVSAGTGNGQIAVKFNALADESHPTQWRLVTAQGPGPWMTVTKSTVTTPVTQRALTYGIEFKRTTTTPVDTAPVSRTVTIVEGQCVTLKVKY